MKSKNQVAIVMGSRSDMKVMKAAHELCEELGVKAQTQILSAHRTPDLMKTSAEQWEEQGYKVIIAGAGGAAHLPGMLASYTSLPVIGVPIKVGSLNGLDALLSVAQMPRGVPVATVAVDNAANAALLACRIIGAFEKGPRKKVEGYKKAMVKKVMKDRSAIKKAGLKQFLKSL